MPVLLPSQHCFRASTTSVPALLSCQHCIGSTLVRAGTAHCHQYFVPSILRAINTWCHQYLVPSILGASRYFKIHCTGMAQVFQNPLYKVFQNPIYSDGTGISKSTIHLWHRYFKIQYTVMAQVFQDPLYSQGAGISRSTASLAMPCAKQRRPSGSTRRAVP